MLYDNGSTTQQVSMNEKNAKAAEELSALKEQARLRAEEKSRENLALKAEALGRNQVMSEIEKRIAQQQQQRAQPSGLFDYFLGDRRMPEQVQKMASAQEQEMNNYQREQNVDRFSRIFGNSNNLSDEEISNAFTLMESNKKWTDDEILNMSLNKEGKR